ncbi:MAG: ABC transporter ATP-binding protein [Planctomycetes bacterium]|nr:ABC transporter ATP-binding protein [Planctomycetota bacterium]
MSSGLVLEGVSKSYGKKEALRDLTLRVPPGTITVFLGPNGAGKTTTIKLVAGLLRPDAGRIRVDGIDLSQAPLEAKRRLSYIPDEPYLYDKLTGREFLRFVGRLQGLADAESDRRIGLWGERFEAGAFLDTLTESYSHGMKQRVVFCAALLRDPTVLVIDEPLVGLDPHTIRTALGVLRERAEAGGAILISSHSIQVLEGIADRAGILQDGRLVEEGPVAEVVGRVRPGGTLEEAFFDLTERRDPGVP